MQKPKMDRSDISRKIKKPQKWLTLRGHHGLTKPNIKNLFNQILVLILKILHAKNEEDPLENQKKMVGATRRFGKIG
jgi:hypothetical protein